MQLILKDSLPFTRVTVAYQGQETIIENVLVDTGSASTIFSVDMVSKIEITPLPDDILYVIRGVGGSETVFSRTIDYVQVGEQSVTDMEIEVGGMDYGFEINGILGMDFLTQAGAILDLQRMEIYFT